MDHMLSSARSGLRFLIAVMLGVVLLAACGTEGDGSDSATAGEDPTSAEETTPEEKTTSAEETTTEEKTTSAEETTPEEKTTSAEETTTEEETTSAEETTPEEETTSAEETTTEEETTSTEETTTSEDEGSGEDLSYTFTGSGTTTTETTQFKGDYLVTYSVAGNALLDLETNFIADLSNKNDALDWHPIVNEIGTEVEGSTYVYGLDGDYYMDVIAEGDWSIEFTQQ